MGLSLPPCSLVRVCGPMSCTALLFHGVVLICKMYEWMSESIESRAHLSLPALSHLARWAGHEWIQS